MAYGGKPAWLTLGAMLAPEPARLGLTDASYRRGRCG